MIFQSKAHTEAHLIFLLPSRHYISDWQIIFLIGRRGYRTVGCSRDTNIFCATTTHGIRFGAVVSTTVTTIPFGTSWKPAPTPHSLHWWPRINDHVTFKQKFPGTAPDGSSNTTLLLRNQSSQFAAQDMLLNSFIYLRLICW